MTTPGRSAPEPSPVSGSGAEHLVCGADVDELLEQVADGHADELTHHQSGCEYCQAALTEFTALWSPVAQAAAVPFAVPVGLAGTLTAAVMADIAKFPTTPPATPSPAPATGGLPLQRWLPQLLAVLTVAAIITVIVLVSRRHGPKTGGPVPLATAASSFIGAPTTDPSSAPPTRSAPEAAPPPTSTAPARPLPPAAGGYPTAVPAGTGGQAASTTAGTRDEQLATLLAGVVLIAASGGYLIRRRR